MLTQRKRVFSVARGDSGVCVLRVFEFVATDPPCGNCDVLVADILVWHCSTCDGWIVLCVRTQRIQSVYVSHFFFGIVDLCVSVFRA